MNNNLIDPQCINNPWPTSYLGENTNTKELPKRKKKKTKTKSSPQPQLTRPQSAGDSIMNAEAGD